MDVQLREATPEDAEQIINYVLRLLKDPLSNMERSEGEFNISVEEERKILQEYNEAKNAMYIVAEENNQIVGLLQCSCKNKIKTKHTISLGISVDQEYRKRGIGRKMMEYLLDRAKNNKEIKRIELLVFETNENAIELYTKMGFEIEGRKRKAVYKDGQYIDELVMGLLL
jgi:RimJ/RimL family protein N-acetyltransferase